MWLEFQPGRELEEDNIGSLSDKDDTEDVFSEMHVDESIVSILKDDDVEEIGSLLEGVKIGSL